MRHRHVITWVAACVLALTQLVGCSSDDNGDRDVATDDGHSTDETGGDVGELGDDVEVTPDSGDEDAPDTVGPPDTPPPRCDADRIERVQGSVADPQGAAIAEALVQLCVRIGSRTGILVCLRPVATAEDGTYTIDVPVSARCVGGGVIRAFVANAPWATATCRVDTASDDGVLVLDRPTVLFPTTPAAAVPLWGDPRESRSVEFADGLTVDLVPAEFGVGVDHEDYAQLASAAVDPDDPGVCFDTSRVDALFAFSPETDLRRGGSVRIPNTLDYAPGARVALFVLGGLDTTLESGATVQEAEWRRYGTAFVDDDGETIAGRIPALTWIGFGPDE